MKMKTGIELIAIERAEQIEKHGRTIEHDKQNNRFHQLSQAAGFLCLYDTSFDAMVAACPHAWNLDLWEKMCMKPYKERCIIAAALLAAEIDRIQE